MVSAGSPPKRRAESATAFRFRGGHPALDLTATLLGRLKDKRRDLLETSCDVEQWLRSAGYDCVEGKPDDDCLTTALKLREAIYSSATERLVGRDIPKEARDHLNEVAQLTAAAPQLSATGETCLHGTANALLAFVARDAVMLFGGELADRVRQCEGDGCAILFLDTSRSGDRRWCSMAACGNRHKVASYRKRNQKQK